MSDSESPDLLSPEFTVRSANGEQSLNAYTREGFEALTQLWTRSGWQQKFSYDVTWLGIPIIQLPEDILMMQELIWKVRPTVVVESGIAHGGAVILYASLLELLGRGRVIGVDIEIRKYNRLAMESHPLSHRLHLIEGSSVEPETLDRVKALIGPQDKVLVVLDSNHTRDHVAAELSMYSDLVSPDSYIVVFDGVMTLLTDAPGGAPEWEEDNPLTAVRDFLSDNEDFEVDPKYNRLGVTYCQNGFLRRRRPE